MKVVWRPVSHRRFGFDGRADGAGFAAMLVHDDVGLDALVREARLDEIHLRLDRRQIVLRAALQHEGACRAKRGWESAKRTARCSWAARWHRPAMISSGFQPWRWKSTMSDCMKTAQP